MTKDDWRVEALRQVGGWLIAAALIGCIVYFIVPNHKEEIRKLNREIEGQLDRMEVKLDSIERKLDK